MAKLVGNVGIGHVRYPTAGSKSLCAEAQPLYTNYPHGLCIAHNGTLTNTDALRRVLAQNRRHVNTGSDSEVLLNIFAQELEQAGRQTRASGGVALPSAAAAASSLSSGSSASSSSSSAASPSDEAIALGIARREDVFTAARNVIRKCTGGFAVVMLVAGVGMLAFRDPNGIRPLVYGFKTGENGQSMCVMSSESVAIDALGLSLTRDVRPGEAVLVDFNGKVHSQLCDPTAKLRPCIFEYVYFARPDSIMDSVPVYESRLRMGEKLALKIMRERPEHNIVSGQTGRQAGGRAGQT